MMYLWTTALSSWLAQVMRLIMGTPQDVTFVDSTVDLFDTFVESQDLKLALQVEDVSSVALWQRQLNVAFRLCRDLEREGRMDIDYVSPIMYRLIIGTFSAEHGLSPPLRDQMFLLHAIVGISQSPSCPKSLFHSIIQIQLPQLCTIGPVYGRTPLAMACFQGHAWMTTILVANPDAALLADSNGHYPLHLACQTAFFTWETGLRALFHAAPQVLQLRTANGWSVFGARAFFQAQHALGASSSEHKATEHTNTLYHILVADPTVVRDFLNPPYDLSRAL